MENIGILGAGSWGIALANLLAGNGHKITVWSVIEAEINMLKEHGEHLDKLPGVKLNQNIEYTTDLAKTVEGKSILVMAVPSPFVRSTAASLKGLIKQGQIVVNVAKGIEEATLMTMTQVIEDEIPDCRVAVLSGPSHAEEVGRGLPTTIVVGSHEEDLSEYLQEVFMSPVFRVYTGSDMLGIELGAALKNVIALAAGIADGLGYGDNTKAALITRGIAEIARLGVRMGGKFETFCGLSGIGDLIVTCASVHSRNRKAGYLIGQGKIYDEAMKEVKMVVEGVYSAKAAMKLAVKYEVEVPIIEEVNKILFENLPASEAMGNLMTRDKKREYIDLSFIK